MVSLTSGNLSRFRSTQSEGTSAVPTSFRLRKKWNFTAGWISQTADTYIFSRRFYGMPKLLETVVKKGKSLVARRTLLYGTHGIGKSTFAAAIPGHLILDIEDGLNDIECKSSPKINSTDELMGWISELYTEKHKYKALVIDTIDFLERMIWKEVCEHHGKESLGDFGFGKGYAFALAKWNELTAAFDALREKCGMSIWLLAHAATEKYENPETEPYDRYAPRIHKGACQLLLQWCDEVFFASQKVYTVTDEKGFGQERTRGISGEDRVMRTEERAAFVAKSRLTMPLELSLSYAEYAKYLKKGKRSNG